MSSNSHIRNFTGYYTSTATTSTSIPTTSTSTATYDQIFYISSPRSNFE
jgi:hypothetical protein